MSIKKSYIAIVGNPHSNPSARVFLHKFTKLLASMNHKLIVFSGDKPPRMRNIVWIKLCLARNNVLLKIISLIHAWIITLTYIIKLRGIIDAIIILPSIMIPIVIPCKVIKKKIAKYLDGLSTIGPLNILVRLMFPFINVLIVESPSLILQWRVPRAFYPKTFIGSLYVDLSMFKPLKDLNERSIDVGFLGRLTIQKGILELIKAIYVLIRRGKKIRVMIIGGGPLKIIIENMIKKFGLSENIIITGIIDYSDIPKHLNNIRLLVLPAQKKTLVLPSTHEGLPNVILEAMACGTPVLATPVGGVQDIIKDNVTGFIIPRNDYRCLAFRISAVLNNIKELKTVSLNSLILVKRLFSPEAAKLRYEKILKILIDN